MAVTVYIPTPFRRATNNRDRLEASAKTVGGLLDELEGTFTGLKGLVRGEGGEVHHHVNIYVNSEAIESLDEIGRHTSELQSPCNLVCRLLLEKKKKTRKRQQSIQHS